MPQKKYRALVIGCGLIGSENSERDPGLNLNSHAGAYRAENRAELVGVCDLNESRAEAAGKFWSVPYFTDFLGACTKLKPDIVSICTPDSTHASIALKILDQFSPKIMLIEKPLSLSLEDADKLILKATDCGTAIAVNYSRRYLPVIQKIKKALDSEKCGKQKLLKFTYGKGLLHNGTHALDLARFWLGEPIAARRILTSSQWGPEGDPTLDAYLEFENGSRCFLHGFDERLATVFEMDLITENSRWAFKLGGQVWEYFEVKDSQTHPGYRNFIPAAFNFSEAGNELSFAIKNLLDNLDGTSSLVCPAADAIRTLKLAEEIRKS